MHTYKHTYIQSENSIHYVLGVDNKRRGDSTLSCIDCQSSSGSHRSWQFWHTKFRARPLRFIYTAESQNTLASICSAAIPLLDKQHAFRSSSPTVWNSLPQTVLISDSLTVFKCSLKTFLFNQVFTEHWSDLPPAPLKLRLYGAIEIRLLLFIVIIMLRLGRQLGTVDLWM